MKKIFSIFFALVLAVSLMLLPGDVSAGNPCPDGGTPALVDSIDIGNPLSEAGHGIKGWGPIEPTTHGGNWGGIGSTPEDGTCRVTWEPAPIATDDTRIAKFYLKVPDCKIAEKLELRVLDGQADDSFEVYINKMLRYTYAWSTSTSENWGTHTIDLAGLKGKLKVEIKATGPSWGGFSTYGQLGVQWANLYACDGLDYVDIGNTMSEAKHNLVGWGPTEPVTHGGSWGGIAPGDCRVLWEPGTGDIYRSASFKMDVKKICSAKTLRLRVLDGLANDSYMVFVKNELVYWFAAPHTGKTLTEEWFVDDIDLTTKFPSGLKGKVNVVIVATGPAWSGHGTYGQVAFDWALLLP